MHCFKWDISGILAKSSAFRLTSCVPIAAHLSTRGAVSTNPPVGNFLSDRLFSFWTTLLVFGYSFSNEMTWLIWLWRSARSVVIPCCWISDCSMSESQMSNLSAICNTEYVDFTLKTNKKWKTWTSLNKVPFVCLNVSYRRLRLKFT